MERAETIRIADHHHEVRTEIIIAAAQSHVWRVLTNFAAMPNWSPSFKGMTGDISDGGQVTTLFDMGEGVEAYTATLILNDSNEFGWSEDYDGIRDNHRYRVEATGENQCKFIQTDAFVGQADWAISADLAEMYLTQYRAFNRALKAECERQSAPTP